MNVAIIGCGLIGRKRAANHSGSKLIACVDTVEENAQNLVAQYPGASAYTDWKDVLKIKDIDIVIVATTHNVLAEITLEAIKAGKHVLVEKPAACEASQLEPIIEVLKNSHVAVRVGFNHRYHPALIKAKEIFDSGEMGELMFIRGRYGHGGRPGYDKEWRAEKEISGGGELIDQGMHLIDLSRLFLGDFDSVQGFAHTYFWDMKVEDNGFMILRTQKEQTAFLHATWTEWKNMFSFEIYGRDAKIEISGLGGSYGIEKLTYYKMLPEMGPPETTSWEFPQPDKSWSVEFAEFLEDIRLSRKPSAGINDAYEALKIVEKLYSESGK